MSASQQALPANSDFFVHPSDWHRLYKRPDGVPAGTLEEAEALAAIDAAREDELAALTETPADRARRQERTWKRRERHLRGW